MNKPAGLRSLSLVRESGSTARVLNLALVHERFGRTPDHAEAPFFRSAMLNRALILKHVLRPNERALFLEPPLTAMKIVFPFAGVDLELGGQALLYGERRFERALSEALGDGARVHLADDLELLRLLNDLPSFDPFLMRERLRQCGYEPARCYFDMSEADLERMRAFVGKEILALVGLAYANGGAEARDLSQRLADKLMTDETARALDPLRQTLQLSELDYREGVFAWKGFLYYKWICADLLRRIPALTQELTATRISGGDAKTLSALAGLRKRIDELMNLGADKVDAALLDYGAAFAGLAEGRPSLFRDFLLRAPDMFEPIGEAIGTLTHIESFWRFRFPHARPQLLPADEALDIFTEFEATLGGMAVARRRLGADDVEI